MTYPSILRSGSSNILEFFDLRNNLNFCLPELRKINFGWREAGGGNDKFFFEKITHVFGDTLPVKKKWWGIHFLKEFFDFDQKKLEKNWGD